MTLVEAEAPEATYDLAGIAPWPPTRYTRPLTPDFHSWYERYRDTFRKAWWSANGYCLERWQDQLLHAITEVDAFGILRYREVLISVGRQNGKTEIVAALGLLFMVAKRSPTVISVASSREQAQLVYKRALDVATRSATLAPHFARMTNTRGLTTITGGEWELKAAKSAALQGIPIDLGGVDEVHLVKSVLWTDMVNGLGDRDDCMVVGITTAGDDDSELLLRLYERDDAPVTRFGRFVWEAPEARVPKDDNELARWLAMANPGIASGRRKVANAVSAVRGMPQDQAIRYRLNRFVSGSDNAYIAVPDWNRLTVPADAIEIVRPILTIDRTPDWTFATIIATGKTDDDKIAVEVAMSIPNPSVEALYDECVDMFGKVSPETFVVDGYTLGALAKRLKENGYPVRTMSFGDEVSAASMFYSKVVRGHIVHAAPGLAQQFQNVARKATHGDQYKLVRGSGPQSIEAALATVRGVYAAETSDDGGSLIY
ncbi:hypothetical protein HUN59_04670 [Curtobacterium sp. Csp2]|uniref:terminase large subunit domain-containing protein n=1 Tax=Curtobacterium sp. Csp2 TaxID=2495430 RepID=UPI0015811BBA|nr:terminase large subunit [Curtobacterium sp. Csp2]QKS15604.1 hypothetical protein HUN59_04670 [Curtobacterium sp. Csp2]